MSLFNEHHEHAEGPAALIPHVQGGMFAVKSRQHDDSFLCA